MKIIFKRLLTTCMVCFVICNATLSVMASESELDNRTIVICDQEGNITYETFENSISSYTTDTSKSISENGLIITPGYDGGYGGDTSLEGNDPNDNLISPLANNTTLVPIESTTVYPYKTFC